MPLTMNWELLMVSHIHVFRVLSYLYNFSFTTQMHQKQRNLYSFGYFLTFVKHLKIKTPVSSNIKRHLIPHASVKVSQYLILIGDQ